MLSVTVFKIARILQFLHEFLQILQEPKTYRMQDGTPKKASKTLLTKQSEMCYARFYHGGIAQLVEHTAHIRSVCGSIPHAANTFIRLCAASNTRIGFRPEKAQLFQGRGGAMLTHRLG